MSKLVQGKRLEVDITNWIELNFNLTMMTQTWLIMATTDPFTIYSVQKSALFQTSQSATCQKNLNTGWFQHWTVAVVCHLLFLNIRPHHAIYHILNCARLTVATTQIGKISSV